MQYFCSEFCTVIMQLTRSILRLALPSIVANITIPLVGIVDVAITGHISDSSAIGGIAIGTMLFDLLYWNFGFLRVGTSGLTAQAYGSKDIQSQRDILFRSVATALSAAVVIWLLQWLFVSGVLAVMPCSEAVADFAREYFYIRIWAAPATLSLMALKGWFIGMQDTVSPMVSDIVVNVANMAASYALAVYTPLGAMGVAWGTLIAQYTGLLTVCVILFFKYLGLLKGRVDIKSLFRGTEMRRLFSLNGNIFIRSICFIAIYVGYTAIASIYGDTELAVSTIVMKLFMFFSYFIDGFAYAGEALAGRLGMEAQSSGSNSVWHKTEDVKHVVGTLMIWGAAIGVVFSLIFWLSNGYLMNIMTSDAEVLAASRNYIVWIALMPVVSSFAFMWDGVYIGATAAVPVRNCMIWSAVAFGVVYFVFSPAVGIQALYAAYMAHLLVRTIYLSIAWRKVG